MKSSLALGAVLVVVSASPLIDYSSKSDPLADAPHGSKPAIGGLSVPSTFASSLNTQSAPVNYGNLNMGTGMMPTQVVHYGTENHPDHGQISPTLISTTAKEASFQLAKADKAGHLINADVDVGKLNYAGQAKHLDFTKGDLGDMDDDDDNDDDGDSSKWGWGRGDRWNRGGWRWRRYRYPYWYNPYWY
ncbi:hypothetical protein BGZ76_010558 [Entomortierella beljakovae]|nr:hypothetical protein BGZ76_010558 [Entomortierella beljakovae]